MQQIYLESFFKNGYRRFMKYISNIAHLDDKVKKIIYHRVEILEFFQEFGLLPTKRTYKVSRGTLYSWKKRLKDSGGRLSSLAPQSKAPKTRSKRKVKKEHKEFIKEYRNLHPGVSKETIYPELKAYCQEKNIRMVSESTIGRVIKELKEQGKLPQHIKLSFYAKTGRLKPRQQRKQKKLRRKDYQPKKVGDLVQIDAIELFIEGARRYIITAIDVVGKFGFAYAYKSLSSVSACDFMEKLIKLSPFSITHIQTDNGREFHKYFAEYIQSQNIIHFYNYPKCPKMNAFIENFNGLIQRQYVSWHQQELRDDIDSFNLHFMDYLLWYNTIKPHSAIGKIPPLRYYVNTLIKQQLNLSPIPSNLLPKKFSMLWTNAIS